MVHPAITRRSLLRGLGALGLALPAVGLAACGGTATVTTTSSTPATTTRTATAQRTANTGNASTTQATKPAAAPSVAPGTIQLVYMCDIGAPYTTVAQHWADTFPQTHSGVTVQYQPVVSNYNDKLTAAYAAGTPPGVPLPAVRYADRRSRQGQPLAQP
jgi:ABC-type glycerol-3-phosphate transport system substrate-binding protein